MKSDMQLEANALIIVVPWWLLAALGLLVIATLIWYLRALPKHWETVSADVHFAELGTVTIRPNREDVQLAHQAWVELATRKAGMRFDPEYDLIIEIYNSWYELFGRLRALASQCPATKLRTDPNTRQLVATLTQVLNRGIRPHLTQWQAQFRRWYNAALNEAAADEPPQAVQRRYPKYEELVSDLAAVQEGLQRYMDLLKELATGEQ